jgi:hypothetical protein
VTRPRDMPTDFVDRTRQLLADSRLGRDDIARHTRLSRTWIEGFAACTEAQARQMDASLIARLHDWLILTDLASAEPRFGPGEAILLLGQTADYLYRQSRGVA